MKHSSTKALKHFALIIAAIALLLTSCENKTPEVNPNKPAQKKNTSILLGAALLMATSAIGPGFLTQTSNFTATYLASFAFVIVMVIIMDMVAQTNIWSIIAAYAPQAP